jgi:filamentous hemagglutinin family protein
MNSSCYKVIFSKRLGTLVAVGEHTSSCGKTASGQACRGVITPASLAAFALDGFVGALRFSFASVALACLSLGSTQAQSTRPALASNALPTGGSVNTGSVSINAAGAQMAISQASDKASINWSGFNIGTGASVNISQPSASSVLLNRVVGQDPSQIFGKLSANGQVILINPNGIVFGRDGSVTATSFTASTFNLTDADFMSGFYKYNRNGSTAAVVNEGTIETSGGGFVALIGASVTNDGKIIAPRGNVIMAAAESVTVPANVTATQAPSESTVSIPLSKKVRLELSPATLNAAIENTQNGVIVTEGGQVLLQASTISTAVASITHSGNIDTSGTQGGAVQLLAERGNIKVDGAIKANSSGNDGQGQTRKGGDILIGRDEVTGALSKTTDVSGARLESDKGFVETSGELLQANAVRVKAGEWLLDPTNITIASAGASGTAYAANYTAAADSVILASDINDSLNLGTSVTIATSATGASAGNIAVNESISKTAGTDATLTLKAHGDINLAASKTITSTSGKLNVILNSDFDGNSSGAITLASGSGITSYGGNITLGGGTSGNGTGSAFGSSFHGIGLVGASISSGVGNVNLTGTSATSGNSAFGVYMDTNANITTTTGAVNITATGQTSGQYGYGMIIRNGAKVITGSGNITVNATGSNVAVSDAMGIQIRTPGAFTTASGNISITGISRGTSGNYNGGIDFASGGSIVAGSTGTVTITGTASSVGAGSVGVNTANATTTGAAVNITGTASSGGATAYDVTPGNISTAGGNVTVTGNAYASSGTETVNAGSGSVTIQNRTSTTTVNVGGTGTDTLTGTLGLDVSSAELGKITAGKIVVGRNDATGSGAVTVSALNMGAMGNTGGDLSVLSKTNIAVNDFITKTAGTDATLHLLANNNITVATNKTITASTGKLNVLLNSDSDAGGAGAIVFSSGSGITSNSGNITLGGGSALDGSGFAVADGVSSLQGVSLNTAAINAGGGNVVMNGKTAATNYVGSLSNISGIYMSGGSISTTGSGTITLTGNNQNTDTQSQGFALSNGTITGGSTGAVTITGDSRGVASSTFDYIRGATLNGTVTSTGGNINITGYGGAGTRFNYGVDTGGSLIAVGSGTLSVTGTAGAGGSGSNVGVNTSGTGTISSVNGAIAIIGTGAIGSGGLIRNHGVQIGGSNAISSTGAGNITVSGTATNNDNGYSQGVAINAGGGERQQWHHQD